MTGLARNISRKRKRALGCKALQTSVSNVLSLIPPTRPTIENALVKDDDDHRSTQVEQLVVENAAELTLDEDEANYKGI